MVETLKRTMRETFAVFSDQELIDLAETAVNMLGPKMADIVVEYLMHEVALRTFEQSKGEE